MGKEYKLVIELTDPNALIKQSNANIGQEGRTNRSTNSNENANHLGLDGNDLVRKKSSMTPKGVFTVSSSLIGVGMYVGNTVSAGQTSAFALRGDFVKAKRQQNASTIINKGVSFASTMAAGGVIGGPAGIGVALAYEGIQLATDAIKHSQETRSYFTRLVQDNQRSLYERERMGYNTRINR